MSFCADIGIQFSGVNTRSGTAELKRVLKLSETGPLLKGKYLVQIHSIFIARKVKRKVKSLSCVRLFVTPWTVSLQAPLSMDFPGKNAGVGCHFLLQEIFLTQGFNLGFPHCRQKLYHPYHQGSHSFTLY